MDGSIKLSKKDRKAVLALYRNAKNARLSRRAHVVLLIADGYSWRTVVKLTFSSFPRPVGTGPTLFLRFVCYDLAMPNWRRAVVPGGTYFFTVVTDQRRPLFESADARTILGNVIRECQ